MTDYVYGRPKAHKVAYIVTIVAVIILLLLVYSQSSILFPAGQLDREQCSKEIFKWCSYCSAASRFNILPSENVDNQSIVGKGVAECSNMYFDSNWTEGQGCESYSDFCYAFLPG
jgi:hypothetical protein